MELAEKVFQLFASKQNSFYIEAGAHDGLTQSNTNLLEKKIGWSGILIEPSLSAYQQCIKNRSDDNVFIHSALVSSEFNQKFIQGDFDGRLMSSVSGKQTTKHKFRTFNPINIAQALLLNKKISTPATTLNEVLEQNLNGREIDFFSLDTEGFELNVLKGLDFKKFKPTYILIEIWRKDFQDIVDLLLSNGYHLLTNLSDYNTNTHPTWGGSHNDYLFKNID